MLKPSPLLLATLLGCLPAFAQVYPEALPTNRSASGINSLRNLALGEPRFVEPRFYNLFDQGGSPMGLLETQRERAGISLGLLNNSRATSGDSLALVHRDSYLPQLRFSQPGVFATNLYYQRESEEARILGGDSVELGASLFGLDLAAGPSSGLFRVGFGAHARMGKIEHSGNAERVLLEIPSLRFDVGSRLHPSFEVGAFAGFSGRFDSLVSPTGNLERQADMALPRYGLLADFGGLEELPLLGNVVLELGTHRTFGESWTAGLGTVDPIIWAQYWTFQTQWMYNFEAGDFKLGPAIRFSHLSRTLQAYEGIKGNQDPFKKGNKIPDSDGKRGTTAFGLGGNFGYRDWVSAIVEWETSGMHVDLDTVVDKRYHRVALGLEQRLDRLPSSPLPEGVSLSLRAGWSWRQEETYRPGYRDYQFDPFFPSAEEGGRVNSAYLLPDDAAGYSALQLGFGAGFLAEKLGFEGLLSFPGQEERPEDGKEKTSGTEFGLEAYLRFF